MNNYTPDELARLHELLPDAQGIKPYCKTLEKRIKSLRGSLVLCQIVISGGIIAVVVKWLLNF